MNGEHDVTFSTLISQVKMEIGVLSQNYVSARESFNIKAEIFE